MLAGWPGGRAGAVCTVSACTVLRAQWVLCALFSVSEQSSTRLLRQCFDQCVCCVVVGMIDARPACCRGVVMMQCKSVNFVSGR